MKDNFSPFFSFEKPKDAQRGDKKPFSFLGESRGLLLGAIALIIAVIELPLGLFVHTSAEFISMFWEKNFAYVITVFSVLLSIPLIASLLLSACALFVYRTTEKNLYDRAGVVTAILSIILCAVDITLYVLSFFA